MGADRAWQMQPLAQMLISNILAVWVSWGLGE